MDRHQRRDDKRIRLYLKKVAKYGDQNVHDQAYRMLKNLRSKFFSHRAAYPVNLHWVITQDTPKNPYTLSVWMQVEKWKVEFPKLKICG